MVKITLVGAGSVVFAKSLICDILQHPALIDSTICLMDIDAGRLATIETLARRIVAQLGLPTRIEATLDLFEACRGARFVITTIQVGGYRPSTIRDFEIPARYGLRQTIADTLGVGGIFRALRTIPELAKVARAMQDVGAPDALLLNYTNPMAMAMWGVDRLTAQSAVGLCHSIQGTSEQIAGYSGIPARDTNYLVAGINHMAFFLRFEYKGKDAYPLLFRALDNPSILACDRVRFEMMRRLGYFVTESSEHQAEYTPYFIHHGQEIIESFNIPINEYIRRCESQTASWSGLERDLLNPDKPVEITRSVEYGATIIHSMLTGNPSVIYGNVPNNGLITNLRAGCCVEVPCLVDRQGIQPTSVGALPLPLAAVINTNLNVQELAVEAAVTKRRDYIYQAVMMDPHTSASLTLDQMWRLCDELIEAHQQDGFLGDFQPVFPNSGRSQASLQRVFLTIQTTSAPFAEGGDIVDFSLWAENATDKAFDGDITLRVNVPELRLAPSPTIRVSLQAGESASFLFTLHKEGDLTRSAVISISSESTITVERDYVLPLRLQCRVPNSVSGQPAFNFLCSWSGNRVADGRSWLEGDLLYLEINVADTDVRAVPAFYWEGSAVEIGLKDISSTKPGCCHYVVLPDNPEPSVLLNGKSHTSTKSALQLDKTCYRLSLVINLREIGIASDQPFLWEVVFHVNALGTAHGKVRSAWQGSENLTADQSRFALVIPTSTASELPE